MTQLHDLTPRTTTLPLVSVVVATHNRPEMLRAALRSVAAQDYTGPVEVVVVFDQSEPDLTLADDDPHRTVRVVANTEHRPGLAGARNTGVLAARGEYVAFCDDDDEWLPTKLTAQVSRLQAGDALTAVSGVWIRYEESEVARVPRAADVTLAGLTRRRVTAAHPSSVVVRRDALLGPIGLVDEDIPGSYGEDYDWILRACKAGEVAVVEEPLVRVHWGSSLFSSRWRTIVEAIDYTLEKHADVLTDRRGLAWLHGRRAFALAALGDRGPALRSAWRTFRHSPRELRAYIAAAVALGLVRAPWLMHQAHRRGRGI